VCVWHHHLSTRDLIQVVGVYILNTMHMHSWLSMSVYVFLCEIRRDLSRQSIEYIVYSSRHGLLAMCVCMCVSVCLCVCVS
jgi:hypothetical protein